MRHRDALTLGERLEVEAAVDAAFAPLREARTGLSPLRVRAAVRWGRGAPPAAPRALRWSGAIARLSELSVAVGMSVLIFAGALGPVLPAADTSAVQAATAVRSAGPSLEEQREAHATRDEWLDGLRSRLEALRTIRLQDWLDPSVARSTIRRVDVPAPRVDLAGPTYN